MPRHIMEVRLDGRSWTVEHLEREIPVGEIIHDQDVKAHCASCPTFGLNLACPPFSPTFDAYADGARRAKVICLRLPVAPFARDGAEEAARACFQTGADLLRSRLLQARSQGLIVAGAGECRACPQCAAITGDADCFRPRDKIYSLESLGVRVADLVKSSFDLELQWTARGDEAQIITVVGAVFSRAV